MEIKHPNIIDQKTEKPYLHHPSALEATAYYSPILELAEALGFEPLEIPESWIKPRIDTTHGENMQGEVLI